MKVKCLSIKQPFASAILTGQKDEEYRTWRTHYRGLLAIHAGKSIMADRFDEYPNFDPKRIQRGVILGVVDLVDCQPDIYEPDVWAWMVRNPRWLARPLPYKGSLGVFDVEIPDELLSLVEV